MPDGVSLYMFGWLHIFIGPIDGWSNVVMYSFAITCGSSTSSSTDCTRA